MSAQYKHILWFAARLFLGGIFVYAGFLKAVEPFENFQAVVLDYEIFPYAWSPPIALIMPWVELILGVFLVIGFIPRFSALALGGISLSFVVLIAASYLKLGDFPESCGCFGEGGLHLKPYQVIVLDIVNTFLGFQLWRSRVHPWALDTYLKRNHQSF